MEKKGKKHVCGVCLLQEQGFKSPIVLLMGWQSQMLPGGGPSLGEQWLKTSCMCLLQGQGFQSSMVSMMGPQGQMAPGGVRMVGPMSGLSAAQQAAVRASMQAVRSVGDSSTNNKHGDLTSVHFPH